MTYREDTRRRLRETLVTAARDLAVADGWGAVRMADVAARAGVSRQTLYNEFRDKPGLAEAVAGAEIAAFTSAVRTELFAHGGDARAASHAAIRHTLREAAANPLVRRILTGSDELMPFLTTRADVVLAAATAVVREWAAAQLPDVDAAAVTRAADVVVRLTISHIMLPAADPEPTARDLADVFCAVLGLGLGGA